MGERDRTRSLFSPKSSMMPCPSHGSGGLRIHEVIRLHTARCCLGDLGQRVRPREAFTADPFTNRQDGTTDHFAELLATDAVLFQPSF